MSLTRSYIPKGKGKTNSYAIKLRKTLTLHNGLEFYHEDTTKESQLFSITRNPNDNSIQLDFDPHKVGEYLNKLNNKSQSNACTT